jgi:hypothetical protein
VICGTSSSYGPAAGTVTLSQDGADLDAVTYHGLEPGRLMQKWLLLDPIPIEWIDFIPSQEAQKTEFDADQIDVTRFNPEITIGQKKYYWSVLQNDYGIIRFPIPDEKENWFHISYVWAQIEMPEEKQAVLGIGSDDAVKVWVNGELVHENWISRGTDYDDDRVPVTFKQGRNQLVLKIQNTGGPWGFCCRMLEE